MPVTTSVTLKTQIDDALALLYQPNERPAQYLVGPTALDAGGSVTTFTLQAPSTVNIGDVLENQQELMRVTNTDSSSPPNITVARGYNDTAYQAAATGSVILRSPLFYRSDVQRQVVRAYTGAIPRAGVPNIKTWTVQPTLNQFYVLPPADVMEILRVSYVQVDNSSVTQKWEDIAEWNWHDDVDPSLAPNGNLLEIPVWMAIGQNTSTVTLYVTYRAPYRWTVNGSNPVTYTDAPSEANGDYIQIDSGVNDLAPLYAAAMLSTGREIGRLELQRVENWAHEAEIRNGANVRLISMLWQEFYRRCDEQKRLKIVPKYRPYRPMRRTRFYWNGGM